MEDSVGEEERREQEETMAQGKEPDGEESGVPAGGGEPGEEGGFLSSVASKIGAAMSGANGSNGAEEEGRKGNGNGDVVASDGEEECKKGGDGGGGIFDKLLSSSPASSPASEADGEKREGSDQDEGGKQAGILSAVASKIGMAMSGAKGIGSRGSEEDAKASNGDAADQSKREDKGDEANGGGIVEQLISIETIRRRRLMRLPCSSPLSRTSHRESFIISRTKAGVILDLPACPLGVDTCKHYRETFSCRH